MKVPDAVLCHDQFQCAVFNATAQFSLIRKKYPALKCYVVLSLPGQQIRVEASPKEILSAFPSMVVDDEAKAELLSMLKTPPPKEMSKTEAERWENQVNEYSLDLKYHGNIQFEIRFNTLNYDLIWKLQSDDLVDRERTPQTRASIRIVLGTLSEFATIAT